MTPTRRDLPRDSDRITFTCISNLRSFFYNLQSIGFNFIQSGPHFIHHTMSIATKIGSVSALTAEIEALISESLPRQSRRNMSHVEISGDKGRKMLEGDD